MPVRITGALPVCRVSSTNGQPTEACTASSRWREPHQGPDQDAAQAGIPGVGDLVAAEQISHRPGKAQCIDLHGQIGTTRLDHGLALEAKGEEGVGERSPRSKARMRWRSCSPPSGAVLLELQQIPTLASAAPDHGPVVVVHHAAVVGGGFRVGHD